MIILDAWTIGRLLCASADKSEVDAVSATFRPLAERLAAMPLEVRQGAWEVFLCGRSDADELNAAWPSGPDSARRNWQA